MEQQSKIGYKKKGTKHQIKTDLKIVDSFYWYRKHGGNMSVDLKLYRKIIGEVNKHIAEQITLGMPIDLPKNFGRLVQRKMRKGLKIENGKVVIDYPIDWGETKKLWREDANAFRDKILIKLPVDWNYYIIWEKSKAKFKYKSLYSFKPARSIKLKTRQNKIDGKMDAIPIVS